MSVSRKRQAKKPTIPTLTPEQRALFDSAPGLAARAVAAVANERGISQEYDAEPLSTATVAAMEATVTYDARRGVSYDQWGFFHACYAIYNTFRDDKSHHTKMLALVRAAFLVHYAHATETFDLFGDTEAAYEEKLHGFSGSPIGHALLYVATLVPTTGGDDDDAVERLAAARAGNALRQVIDGLQPEERRMLDLCYEDGNPMTEAAAILGEDDYRAFTYQFHKLLARLKVRLSALGMREMPSWREDISGKALGGDSLKRKR